MIGIYIEGRKKNSFTLFDTCNFGAVLRAVFGFATKLVDLVNIFRKFCLDFFLFHPPTHLFILCEFDCEN